MVAYPCPAVDRERLTHSLRFRKLCKLIVEADLTAAVNGTAQDIALGFLPPTAVMCRIPAAIKLNTQFTGGGASSVGLSIGTSASPALLMASFSIFGATASGLYVAGTAGPQVEGVPNGQNIIARITPDAGHTLLALTAGSVEIAVYFWNGADGKYFP